MATLNKVCLIGHLGKDPETRYMTNGEPVCNFSIATTEAWKDKASGEKKEKTEWHRITMFSKLAEIAEKYLHKGDLVYVEGKIETREYEKDGQKHYATNINCHQLQMLKTRRDNNPNGQVDDDPYASQESAKPPAKKPAPAAAQDRGGMEAFDDMENDVPF